MEWGSGKFSWLILYVLSDSTITRYCLLMFSFDLGEKNFLFKKIKIVIKYLEKTLK